MEEAISYIQNHLDSLVNEIRDLQRANPNISQAANSTELMEYGKSLSEQMEYYKTLLDGHFPTLDDWPTINIKDFDPSMENHFSPACYISSAIDEVLPVSDSC